MAHAEGLKGNLITCRADFGTCKCNTAITTKNQVQ